MPGHPKKIWPWALGLAAASAAVTAGLLALVPVVLGRQVGAGYEAVEQSWCVLDGKGEAQVLAAGDSRAKNQVIPALLGGLLGKRCVNIAENLNLGGDLATLVNVLRKYPRALAGHPLLLISVSMDGVNDDTFADAPLATLFQFQPYDHLALALRKPASYPGFLAETFFPAVKRQWRHRREGDGFQCAEDIYRPPALMRDGGYRPLAGRRPAAEWPDVLRQAESGSSGSPRIDGARWRVFVRAMAWLAASPAAVVVIYDAPMNPEWLKAQVGSENLGAEFRFARALAAEAARFPKVRFLDFTAAAQPSLGADDFYDGAHLNADGAAKFTRMLADSLAARSPARDTAR